MNGTCARKMSILVCAGLLAGQLAAIADDGQFEDWKVVGNFSFLLDAPSCSRIYAAGVTGGIYYSDNGGDGWIYSAPSRGLKAINPSNPDVVLGESLG